MKPGLASESLNLASKRSKPLKGLGWSLRGLGRPGLTSERPELTSERPGLAFERPGLASERPRLASEGPGLACKEPHEEQTDRRTYRFPLYSTGLCPLWVRCPAYFKG